MINLSLNMLINLMLQSMLLERPAKVHELDVYGCLTFCILTGASNSSFSSS